MDSHVTAGKGLISGDKVFESMLMKMFDGVILSDVEKRLLFINSAATKMLDLESESPCAGDPLSALGAGYLIDVLDQARKQNLHEVNKVIRDDRPATRLIGVHAELLKDVDNVEIGWMFILRDITMNWQVDQMRSSLTIASHEIRTPLNSILGSIQLLLERDLGELNHNQMHCLNIVRDDTCRLNRLLSDILDLSRFEEGVQFIDRRKEVGLTFLVNKVIDSFRAYAASRQITLQSFVPKTIPTFKGDRDRLQQVFSNLVENGIKYSLPGGCVEIHADLSGSLLTCWVKDRGVGIPRDAFDTIFLKFKQLDNYPGQGTRGYGLGLCITKEIIEAIGGKIWVESEINKGSTFYFTIPV